MSKRDTFRDIFYISRRCSDANATLKKSVKLLIIRCLTTHSRHRDKFRCVYIRAYIDSGKLKTKKMFMFSVALSRFVFFMRKRRNIKYIYLSIHMYKGMLPFIKNATLFHFLRRVCIAHVAIFNLNHEFNAFDTKKSQQEYANGH